MTSAAGTPEQGPRGGAVAQAPHARPARQPRDAGTVPPQPAHMLSIDVEEYFQVESARAAGIGPDRWDAFDSRVEPCVDRLLELLAGSGASATFFCMGWVARRHPAMIRRIADAGCEVASHSMNHTMITQLEPEAFRADLRESLALLADLAGRPVLGYRAPTFSVTRDTAWALDAMAAEGLRYDSSVFPVRHDRYGVSDAPREPHWARGPGGGRVLEIPPLTARLAGMNLPVGGGGYLRLLPGALVERAVAAWQARGRAAMIYLHPWEIDPDQPRLALPALAAWRHRVGLARTHEKLRRLLRRFTFRSVDECLPRLESAAAREFRYAL